MAYMSQEKKKVIAQKMQALLKGTGIRYSLAVRNHLSIVLTVKSGPVDFLGNYKAAVRKEIESGMSRYGASDGRLEHVEAAKYVDVNVYHVGRQFSGKVGELVQDMLDVLNTGNWDRSDSQTDYFDVGHYVDFNIGRWNQPYVLTDA
jgi:hypothetical protein